LKEKCDSPSTFQERESKIQQWIKLNGGHPKLDPQLLTLLERESDRTTKEYDVACVRIRKQQEANKSLHRIPQKTGFR
jgi:hypothetical protein